MYWLPSAPRIVARPSAKASAVAFLSRARVNQEAPLPLLAAFTFSPALDTRLLRLGAMVGRRGALFCAGGALSTEAQ